MPDDPVLDDQQKKPIWNDRMGLGPVQIAAPSGTPGMIGVPPINRPPIYSQPGPTGPTSPAPPTADKTPMGAPVSPQNPHEAEAQRLEDTGSGVSQVQAKHPFWGGVLRGLDTAASIIAPPIAAAIPGTTLHHDQLINRQEHLANQDVGREEKQAQTGLQQAETERVAHPKPQLEQTDEGLVRVPEEGEATPVTMSGQSLQKPTSEPKGTVHETDKGMVLVSPDGKTVTPIQMGGQTLQAPTRPENEEAQFVKEYQQQHQGSTLAQAQRAYKLNNELPQRPPQITVMVPSAGGYTPTIVHPGQEVPGNAVTPGGMNSLNVPTAQTRTMAETAPKVIDLANRVDQLIDQQINSLGPAASRWNEFMAGKVGAPNPEFTKLRTDVGLLQTALMRMHVGARGGEQMMEHFQNLIDASKQDPQNLKAALEEIRAYANAVEQEGRGNNQPSNPAAPATAPKAEKPKGAWNPKTGRYE